MQIRIKKALKDHWHIALIVAVFIFVKLLYAQKFHSIIWDEAVYLGIGKWIYSSGQIGLFEIIRPMGLPLIIGLFWKLGLDYVFAAEILEILLSAGVLIMTYLVTKEYTDNISGALAAFVLSVTPVFFLYSGYILTGIPSAFFTMLALYFFIKKRPMAAGIAAGAASLIRFPQGLMFGGLFLTLVLFICLKRSRHLFENLKKMTFSFVGVHLPFLLFNYIIYREETSRLHHALFRPWILGSTHTQNLAEAVTAAWSKYLYYPTELFAMNALVVLSLVGIVYLILFSKKKRSQDIVALLGTVLMYLLFFGSIINKQHRFLLIFLPLIAVLCGVGCFGIVHRLKEMLKRLPKSLSVMTKKIAITHLYLVLCLLVVAYAYSVPMQTNEGYYGWRTMDPPPIVDEYYNILANQPPVKAVLTADPVPAVYVDSKFIPIYFSIDAAEKIYRESLDEASHIVYSNATFYCPDSNEDCKKRVKAFDEEVISTYTPIFEKQYGDRLYYIYKITS